MARLLMSNGADLTTHGYLGRSLLHTATRAGSADTVLRLIERGADVNAVDVHGVTPLDLAAWKQDGEIASLLAAHGAVRGEAAFPLRRHKKQQA
jgi:ankyrin repeat protein